MPIEELTTFQELRYGIIDTHRENSVSGHSKYSHTNTQPFVNDVVEYLKKKFSYAEQPCQFGNSFTPTLLQWDF